MTIHVPRRTKNRRKMLLSYDAIGFDMAHCSSQYTLKSIEQYTTHHSIADRNQ